MKYTEIYTAYMTEAAADRIEQIKGSFFDFKVSVSPSPAGRFVSVSAICGEENKIEALEMLIFLMAESHSNKIFVENGGQK